LRVGEVENFEKGWAKKTCRVKGQAEDHFTGNYQRRNMQDARPARVIHLTIRM